MSLLKAFIQATVEEDLAYLLGDAGLEGHQVALPVSILLPATRRPHVAVGSGNYRHWNKGWKDSIEIWLRYGFGYNLYAVVVFNGQLYTHTNVGLSITLTEERGSVT